MLENENIFVAICWNIILILAWDFIVFCLCKTLNEDQLDYKKYMYKIKALGIINGLKLELGRIFCLSISLKMDSLKKI